MSPEQSIGHYRIESKLGEGGMGAVYRARDLKLNREVAIKVLPDAFAADKDRLSRFTREAQALASLNHPNIASIYGIEDGALVMELVKGATLAERIARGPIPVEEALAIARQIAEALGCAHEKGIIHRDLKPANIKVTPNGSVKVLDFGLAKMAADRQVGVDEPTQELSLTEVGMLIGTPSYMAPEQASGKRVDKRADIWAYGVVLYEMLTGHKPFAGGTTAEILAAVLGREPDWEALRRCASPNVMRLIERCLRKDPNRRLRDIGDAQMDLDDAATERAQPVVKPHRREYLAWCIAGGLAIALLAMLARRGDVQPLESGSITRATIVLPLGLKLAIGGQVQPIALAADAKRVAYVGEQDGRTQLYVREMDELEARALPGTLGAMHPFFSPDGRWIAFFAAGALQKVAATGGAPIRICSVSKRSLGGAWGKSNQIVFALRQSGLFRVDAAGGTPQPLTGTDSGVWPEILPDEKTVLFTAGGRGIAAIPLAGGQRRIVARVADSELEGPAVLGSGGIVQARYLPDGYLIYGQSRGMLRAIAFDLKSLTVSGSPVPILDSLEQAANGGGIYFALSSTGSLVYAASGDRHQLVSVDRAGVATPISSDREAFRHPRLSPDGKRIAVAINDETRRSDIWVYDADRGSRRRVTTVGHNLEAVWSPDGQRLTFSRGTAGILNVRADGSGGPEELVPGDGIRYPSSWSPDGKNLLFHLDGPSGQQLGVFSREGGARLLNASSATEAHAIFSPDGRWIAYSSDESGVSQVYVARFPDLTEKVTISTEAGNFPQWSPDGSELFYRQGDAMMAAPVEFKPKLRVEKPTRLFSGDYSGASRDPQFAVARGGQRFVMIKSDESSTLRQMIVVQNWAADVRRRLSVH